MKTPVKIYARNAMDYKGYNIWHNQLQGWMVQAGYEICYVGKTLGAAKRWVTLTIERDYK